MEPPFSGGMNNLTPPDASLFFSRQDPLDPRLTEVPAFQGANAPGADVTIVGYPDDEGIRLNGGREGAREAPAAIRRLLYKMTPHPRRALRKFADAGDLKIEGDLGARHERAAALVQSLLAQGGRVLGLGGGNDWAYPDGLGLLKTATARPLVLNVDAHFDVRSTERGLNSGTPFRRLLESGVPFDFVELGIQGHCNARAHWEYVESKGGKILTVEEQLESGLSLVEFTTRELGDWLLKRRPCFLAIDLDAFAHPLAAGTSAAWPLGLTPHAFWPLYQTLLARLDVRVLGLYETSPPLDVAQATTKWAAQLAHGFLHEL